MDLHDYKSMLLTQIQEKLGSIMTAEDSPTSDSKGFSYGRSTPPPTTSYDTKKPETGDAKSAAEPDKEDKEKDKNKDEKEEIDLHRPDANPDYKPDEKRTGNDEISKDDKDFGDNDQSCKKLNGTDKLDGQWIPAKDTKSYDDDDEDDQEESCTVKCLYYTLQCCECTIS